MRTSHAIYEDDPNLVRLLLLFDPLKDNLLAESESTVVDLNTVLLPDHANEVLVAAVKVLVQSILLTILLLDHAIEV